ncbi:hypothetical protein M0R45_016198 [Rubus argutus]|uniref:Transmembrane protein n=1 Tax=Rubus argutus TaxID=59490 RepID=A0AAW1XS53_RUBAR
MEIWAGFPSSLCFLFSVFSCLFLGPVCNFLFLPVFIFLQQLGGIDSVVELQIWWLCDDLMVVIAMVVWLRFGDGDGTGFGVIDNCEDGLGCGQLMVVL